MSPKGGARKQWSYYLRDGCIYRVGDDTKGESLRGYPGEWVPLSADGTDTWGIVTTGFVLRGEAEARRVHRRLHEEMAEGENDPG